MNKRYPSIFNDALGPVTPGPSSSNTCAPARIGRMCRRIFGGKPSRLSIAMSAQGGYPGSFLGMRSDLAFLTGVLERPATHARFLNAREDAAQAGIAFSYCLRDDLPGDPPELAVLALSDGERTMEFTCVSEGGGAFAITRVDGCPVELRGDCYELLFFCRDGDESKDDFIPQARALGRYGRHAGQGRVLHRIGCERPVAQERIEDLAALCGAAFWRFIPPESPVLLVPGRKPPFETPAELAAWQRTQGVPLWRAAAAYEAALSGWTEAEVLAYASEIWSVVERSVEGGLKDGLELDGIVEPKAARVKAAFSYGELLPLGMLDAGVPAALSVMEFSNASGTIACIPTGGASGVVPGALIGAARSLGKGREELVRALLVAGIYGVFMEKTKYFGALGCQAEIGCAAGMAAAGLVALLGGGAEQAECAASLAIQSLLGLVCDPVCGLVQVPCFIRNMTGVSTAAVCANAAMAGVAHVIPLDEMVDAMLRVGQNIRKTRCNRLGTESTPTGLRLAREWSEKKSIIDTFR
jgi:L-serine dehydratase